MRQAGFRWPALACAGDPDSVGASDSRSDRSFQTMNPAACAWLAFFSPPPLRRATNLTIESYARSAESLRH